MEGRTCILVSHNVALTLKNAEWVVFMENGRVKDQGEPLELYNKGLLGEDELVKTSVLSRGNSSTSLVGKLSKSGINLSKLSAKIEKSSVPSKKPLTEEERVKIGKLIEEETKSEGVVSIEVYKWFAKLFGGWKMVIFLASIFIVAQCVYIFQSWWVRAWASHNTYDATRKFIARILPEGTVNGLLPLVGLENQLSVSPVIEETVKQL